MARSNTQLAVKADPLLGEVVHPAAVAVNASVKLNSNLQPTLSLEAAEAQEINSKISRAVLAMSGSTVH